jgi:hypothetical protein
MIVDDLTYYLDRKPTSDEVAEAEEWQQDHPGVNLSEWVDAMIEIGAL